MSRSWQQTSLESLEVGAAPLVRHFLNRLQLPQLFEQHLPSLPGRQPALSSAVTLTLLVTNVLLARQPLYALAAWTARRAPEYLGLQPGQAALLNDDRCGRALDHLQRADRASLLTALVLRAVRVFAIDLTELHQDTTTVTFSGEYAGQPPAEQGERSPRITFGYNKDHRPDLKLDFDTSNPQLSYSHGVMITPVRRGTRPPSGRCSHLMGERFPQFSS